MTLKAGDKVWVGGTLEVFTDGYGIRGIEDEPSMIPDVPNLAHIARFLADHPETVDALELCHSWLNGIDVPWPDDLCEAATRLLELTKAMRGEGKS